MRGKPALFLPGQDHAGIATQMLVERALAEEGIKRQDIGREAFLNKVRNFRCCIIPIDVEVFSGVLELLRQGISYAQPCRVGPPIYRMITSDNGHVPKKGKARMYEKKKVKRFEGCCMRAIFPLVIRSDGYCGELCRVMALCLL